MASKRSKSELLESPPSASPSEHSSDEGEESSSEESTPNPKPAAQKPQSSASGDSGSESESESEPEDTLQSVPESVVKPQASKPISKPTPKTPTPAVEKRPAESVSGKKESKKAKVAAEAGKGDRTVEKSKVAAEAGKGDRTVEKSTPRVWSEEDEIAILKGIIDYEEKVGSSPSSDMEAFHAFIKKSLRADASRSQLYEKVRRLKKKYLDNVEKLKKDVNVSSSWKPHENKLFNLSKNIWRSEGNGLQSPKVEKTKSTKKNEKLPLMKLETTPTPLVDGAKNVEDMETQKKNWAPWLVCGSGDSTQLYVLENGLPLIKGPQRAELEERLANLRKAEMELFARRTKIILDQTNLLLAAKK